MPYYMYSVLNPYVAWWDRPKVTVAIIQEELLIGRNMAFAQNKNTTVGVKFPAYNICFGASLMIDILHLAINCPTINQTMRGGKYIGVIFARVL